MYLDTIPISSLQVITPESINPDLSLLLLNAIYFKGAWEIPFESDLTRPASFFIPGQEAVQTDTMFLDSEVRLSYKHDSYLYSTRF